MNHSPTLDHVWDQVSTEFTLPTLEQVRERLSTIHEDPDPVLQQVVRVFIDDGTYCPGYQFLPDLSLHPTVTALFRRAIDMRVPHNYFTAWMITPRKALRGRRPVDLLDTAPVAVLLAALEQSVPGPA
ncbi:MbcA/ParS/Xre antitoxin family protein [Paenarthrobacter sp. NPDC089989]|uniref:MbcA/ParS/Xre antitoxin family protein n=1 Tax=unclassified Paenarthrobacter TaxID=2634190 RepID=UPI00380F0F1E